MSSHDDNDIELLSDDDFETLDEDEPKTQVSNLTFDDFEPTVDLESRPSLEDLKPKGAPAAGRPNIKFSSEGLPSVGIPDDAEETVDRAPLQRDSRPLRSSGQNPAQRQSGQLPAQRQSGQIPAQRQSGQLPAQPQSGQIPAQRQSGQQPRAERPSGGFPAADLRQSGQQPRAERPSGGFPAADLRQSGQLPSVDRQSGGFPAANPDSTRAPSGPLATGDQDAAVAPNLDGNFYNIPTGHTGRLQSVAGPATPRQAFVRGLLAAVPVGLIAIAVVAYFSVQRWLTPTEALLWSLLGVAFPTVFASLIVAWPAEGQKANVKSWIIGLAPGLVMATLGLVVAGAWQQSAVRTAAVEYVPDEPEILTRVFQEQDLALSIEACKRMVSHIEQPEWRIAVLRNMTLRPATAAQCLKSLPDSAERDKVVTTVSQRWQKELLASTDGGDRNCQLAASMTELSIDQKIIDAQLLTCTLTAVDEAAQDCCAKILSQKLSSHEEMVSGIRASLDVMAGREAAGSLMSMSFHQNNLTKPQENLAKRLKFTSNAAQRATLSLGCENLEQQEDANIVPHLAASLGKNCTLDNTALPQDPEDWLPVCDNSLAALDADAALEPSVALCKAATAHFAETAIAKASRFLAHAVRSNQRSEMGDKIDLGFQAERESEMSPQDLVEKAQLQRQFIADGMSPAEAAAKAGIDFSKMGQISANAPMRASPTEADVAAIMGRLNSAEAGAMMSDGAKEALRESAENAGVKLQERSDEGGEQQPPPGARQPPQ